jgi:hypothetical protein
MRAAKYAIGTPITGDCDTEYETRKISFVAEDDNRQYEAHYSKRCR